MNEVALLLPLSSSPKITLRISALLLVLHPCAVFVSNDQQNGTRNLENGTRNLLASLRLSNVDVILIRVIALDFSLVKKLNTFISTSFAPDLIRLFS